jgi:uncharacterized pyridoxal phosphate-containing UPF0001 family protein
MRRSAGGGRDVAPEVAALMGMASATTDKDERRRQFRRCGAFEAIRAQGIELDTLS